MKDFIISFVFSIGAGFFWMYGNEAVVIGCLFFIVFLWKLEWNKINN